MTTKYPRPCEGCDRLMRPASPGAADKYPEAETAHHARGKCRACVERERRGDKHLIGQPIREYGFGKPVITSQPITFSMLMRIGELHPPTAKYITDRRLRGVPTEGLRKQRMT